MSLDTDVATFPGLIDLASERIGGKALLASDEFFAPKENLLNSGRGIFIPDQYTDHGKWMDGWESRRKRTSGHDWCMIELGLPGVIRGVDIDTNHFLGNHPPYASIDACSAPLNLDLADLSQHPNLWTEILPKSPLRPGSQNLFSIQSADRWTHVRLNIYPDGGVARFRVYGDVLPDWSHVSDTEPVDLAAMAWGGRVVSCSDMFFGSKDNLIMPGRARNMGEGWETKRRRGPGLDWAVIQLGTYGLLKTLEIDTAHFKGNYPDRCEVLGCLVPLSTPIDVFNVDQIAWMPILSETKLQADTNHRFDRELQSVGPCSHVRLNIYPDGGVSRLRAYSIPQSSTFVLDEMSQGALS